MFGKTKTSNVPSDAQAKERLATYVYEYLVHVGASKAATTFLQEIGWDKRIQVADSPGFLHSWWCVFWDLYCACPERRDTCEHSTEAKAFHDYSSATAPSPLNPMPPDGMGGPGMPPGYFPPGSTSSPSPQNNPMMRQPFMSPRYPHGAPRSAMQGPGSQSMLQGMDHPRQGHMVGMSRMVHPRGMPPGSINPYAASDQFQQQYGAMRMPPSSMPGHGGMPMPMHGRSPWPNQSGPSCPTSAGPPSVPMMRSPQGPRPPMQPGPHPHRFPPPHDPKNPDPMNADYAHMSKPMPHQQMPSSYPMGSNVPENMPSTTLPMSTGPGLPVSTPNMTPGLNGMNGAGPDPAMMEGLPKSSPSNNMPMNSIVPGGPPPMGPPGGPGGTPHTPQDGEGEGFNMVQFNDNDQTESAAILKIKESMQLEAKRFEIKDNDGNGPNDYSFMS